MIYKYFTTLGDAVDGRDLVPADSYFIPLLSGYYTSQVAQEFFHQQYN